ncbi:MAG: hypothetical protein A4E65_03096 [Syntrophorhabdus sp. PtaU1.Bin153]|nr:MAG: hypothetical protein A4E65_03096 [Syntrophorhabdus sp. PtaU1.Bin153]
MARKKKKTVLYNMRLTEEERELIRRKAEEAGFESMAEYIMDCIRKDRRKPK